MTSSSAISDRRFTESRIQGIGLEGKEAAEAGAKTIHAKAPSATWSPRRPLQAHGQWAVWLGRLITGDLGEANRHIRQTLNLRTGNQASGLGPYF